MVAMGMLISLSAQTPLNKASECFDLYDAKQYQAALKCADGKIKNDSMLVEAYIAKGMALIELKKYQEAYDAYSLGIQRTGVKNELINHRGVFLLSLQEFDAAIKDLSIAYEYAPDDTLKRFALVNRAAAYMSIRQFEMAYDDLLAAVKLDSSDVSAYINLGVIADEIGKGELTLKYYEKALSLDSTQMMVYVNIGFKYQLDGQHDKAIKCFNKVLEADPNDGVAYNNRGYSKMMTGDLKGAMEDVNKAIKLYPANSYAYRNRALIYLRMDKQDKACDDITEALNKGFTTMYGDEMEKLYNKNCLK